MADPNADADLAIIPLRAGSKGLPNKNLLPLAGKPLYMHAVEQALRVIGRCIITTDIAEILNAHLPSECLVIERPAKLAGDRTPMVPVIMHALDELQNRKTRTGRIALLQATSPLREDRHIADALDLHSTGDRDLVMSVTHTDPGILKYGFLEGNTFRPVSSPHYCFENRQNLPEIVRPNGAVYVFHAQDFRRYKGFSMPRIGAIEMPAANSVDIDKLDDLKLAEAQLAATSTLRMASQEARQCA